MHADVDLSGNTMLKKIRTGQLKGYNFTFGMLILSQYLPRLADRHARSVVGVEEKNSRTVNIRNRDDQSTQAKGDLVPLDEAVAKLVRLRDNRELMNTL